jgi:hypothetical protein
MKSTPPATRKPPRPAIPARRQPMSMRSAVLLSLIVCPRGGVHAHRHGQGTR